MQFYTENGRFVFKAPFGSFQRTMFIFSLS